MREELGRDEEVVARLQASKVMSQRDNPRNTQRRYVSALWVVVWFFLALVAISLWMLRLLEVIPSPQG